ncbi:MAG: cell division/cell wall cluster transcriptional repressor MraZ [Rickettsiales bacterium]|nr:cell division/cell wall cluster transcriptional repressor MraZ [Rickettsiales bacterium]
MLFLSTYINKIDKKGRVSVPANFRSIIRKDEFQGVVAYGSFIHNSIEACNMERIASINETIDSLDPYSEERDAFATAIFGGSYQLAFDNDGRISLPEGLLELASLKDKALFVGKGKTFEIWNPDNFKSYEENARKLALEKRSVLRVNKSLKE